MDQVGDGKSNRSLNKSKITSGEELRGGMHAPAVSMLALRLDSMEDLDESSAGRSVHVFVLCMFAHQLLHHVCFTWWHIVLR